MGIPNCLNTAITSNKNCFDYAGVPLIQFVGEYVLSRVANLSTVPSRLFLTVSAESVPGLILPIANFINERIW